MGTPIVQVTDLAKTYRVPQREAGLKASLRHLVRPQYLDVDAVRGVNFQLETGEVVGFIGPNGAGKTTTLKMLSGLLVPSRGEASVCGFIPWERKPAFLRSISMVLGNRSQLTWENTVMDSLLILGEIYGLPTTQIHANLDELIDLLEMQPLLPKMARNLSLGERMRCELAAALLHQPSVIFLDEPTLGLDVAMQFRLRRFFTDYNRRTGATILLTSHYMADVVSLCPRVILIHEGRQMYDGALSDLAERIAPFKLIRLATGNGADDPLAGCLAGIDPPVTVLEHDDRHYTLRVRKHDAAAVTARLLNEVTLADITVEDPPIEAVIDQVYREGVAQ